MKFLTLLAFALCFTCLFMNCNPQCDAVYGLRVLDTINPAGYQIRITAQPVTALKGKRIYFGDIEVPEKDKILTQDMMIIKIPNEVKLGKTNLKVVDPDCQNVIDIDYSIVNKDDFNNNPNFIPPVLPEIIIPTFNLNYPTSIDRAWVSPINTDYILWFGVKKDTFYPNPSDKTKFKINYLLNGGSFEKTCTAGITFEPTKLYGVNPIYGYYDFEASPRRLYFSVDRTKRGLGIEEYIGEFITKTTTSYTQSSFVTPCKTADLTGYTILVTSKKTGRQTVVFQSPSF
jgi:hypothetical protein